MNTENQDSGALPAQTREAIEIIKALLQFVEEPKPGTLAQANAIGKAKAFLRKVSP